ncbi:uncharacterized protein [Patagioenas fasciata]|uniref:uncharacterized protein isoform X2 n=1 Tax=Patagioenas fasciata TaxID=372321 RepID=UPI003A9A3A8C
MKGRAGAAAPQKRRVNCCGVASEQRNVSAAWRVVLGFSDRPLTDERIRIPYLPGVNQFAATGNSRTFGMAPAFWGEQR